MSQTQTTLTAEPTVAHGGTRHGDYLLCTPSEYRELLDLRAQLRQVQAWLDEQRYALLTVEGADDIRAAVL